jgi:hypothetical protein
MTFRQCLPEGINTQKEYKKLQFNNLVTVQDFKTHLAVDAVKIFVLLLYILVKGRTTEIDTLE